VRFLKRSDIAGSTSRGHNLPPSVLKQQNLPFPGYEAERLHTFSLIAFRNEAFDASDPYSCPAFRLMGSPVQFAIKELSLSKK
jgi:hypothetical protein